MLCCMKISVVFKARIIVTWFITNVENTRYSNMIWYVCRYDLPTARQWGNT